MTTIDTLRIVMSVMEYRHFRRAADHHHITPSTLTRLIQRLETEIGTPLFIRNQRSVIPTDAGHRFYEFARQTTDTYDQLLGQIRPNTPDQLRGSIKLYSTVTAAYSILPDILKTFGSKFPHITTYLETGVAKGGISQVIDGNVDFAIGIITPTHQNEIICQKLLDSQLVFVVPAGHPATIPQHIPLILPESGPLATIIKAHIESHPQALQIHSYVEGHEAILAMVAAGLGGAILPQIVIDNSHLFASIRTVPLALALPQIEVGIFAKTATLKSPVKGAFWAHCQQAIQTPNDADQTLSMPLH